MNTHFDKAQGKKSQSAANATQKQRSGKSTVPFKDNRSEAIAQRKMQEMANNSLQVQQAAQLQTNINNETPLESETDIMGAKSLQAGDEKNSPLQHKRTVSKITQRVKDEPNQAQKELADLASEIQENKNDLEEVSTAIINQAISALHEAASSDDKAAATKVFDKLKAIGKGQFENVPEAKNPEPVQQMSKAKKGAWIGIAIGTLVPVVGNIIGGLVGHAKGKQADLNDLMVAYPALTLGQLNPMTQAGAGTHRIRNQLDIINGNNIAHLVQLYNRGASPSNISRLLGFENNGATLDNLLGLEMNHDARRIVKLYQDGVNSANMATLLGHESNGATLHRLINREATNSAPNIIQLYVDGINSAIMYNLLRVQRNGQTVHNYYTNQVAGCIAGNIQFGSLSGGNFGSIYFPFGRIRLVHAAQPAVEPNGAGLLARATLNNADLLIIRNYWNTNVLTGVNTATQMHNHAMGAWLLPGCCCWDWRNVSGVPQQWMAPLQGYPCSFPGNYTK